MEIFVESFLPQLLFQAYGLLPTNEAKLEETESRDREKEPKLKKI